MTFEQRSAALARNQIEQRLIAVAPRFLFRSPTCAEDIQSLVTFVESEINRAAEERAQAERESAAFRREMDADNCYAAEMRKRAQGGGR